MPITGAKDSLGTPSSPVPIMNLLFLGDVWRLDGDNLIATCRRR